MTEVKIVSDEDVRIPQCNHRVTLKVVLQTASPKTWRGLTSFLVRRGDEHHTKLQYVKEDVH